MVLAWQMATPNASAASSGFGSSRQPQQQLDHLLDLPLVRMAVAAHRLFDLHGGIFIQGKPRLLGRQQGDPRPAPTCRAVVTFR